MVMAMVAATLVALPVGVRAVEAPERAWATTASMTTPRFDHSATVLDNGDVFVVGGPSGQAEIYHAGGDEAGTWTASGSGEDRSLHSATLIEGGKVLVAGGGTGRSHTIYTNPLKSAELYDPASAAVVATAAMKEARYAHSATALGDGRVLVAGGRGESVVGIERLASVEIFDPNAVDPATAIKGTWSSALPMSVPRVGHTATALGDGRVLVVGGAVPTGDVSAEVFDPDAVDPATGIKGRWSPAPPMAKARVSHTATALADGSVLVAGGGKDEAAAEAFAEIFDPGGNGGRGSWAPTGAMAEPGVSGHRAAALAGGKVLVVGGSTDDGIAGIGQNSAASAEEFDSATRTWRVVDSPAVARVRGHTATALDAPACQGQDAPGFCGKVLVLGGNATGGGGLDAAELFDPRPPPQVVALSPAEGPTSGGTQVRLTTVGLSEVTAVRFGTLASPSFRREGPTTVLATAPAHPPGKVTVEVEGLDLGGAPSTAPLLAGLGFSYLDLEATGTWAPAGELLNAHGSGASATALRDGRVLVVGGEHQHQRQGSADLFDPATGVWDSAAPPTGARAFHTATLLADGQVLVAGGTGGQTTSVEIFDPAAGSGAGAWHTAAPLAVNRSQHSATLLSNGKVLVAGGYVPAGELTAGDTIGCKSLLGPDASLERSFCDTTEIYDPANDAWTPGPVMDTPRTGHAATVLDGPPCRSSGPARPGFCHKVLVVGGAKAAALYDPATSRWETAGNMTTPRSSPTATALDDGRVLVVGGDDDGSAELYDPVTGTWSRAASMRHPQARHEFRAHTATLIAGPLCGASVTPRPRPCGKVLVAGGQGLGTPEASASVELFDPTATTPGTAGVLGAWEPAVSLITARFFHTATALGDGRVLVAAGGTSANQTSIDLAEVFDPGAKLTQRGTGVTSVEPRVGPVAGGTEVHVRGVGFFGTAATVYFGDTAVQPTFVADDEIIATTPVSPRQGPVAVSVQRRGVESLRAGSFSYAPGTWRLTAALNGARFGHTAAALPDGRVLVTGGANDFQGTPVLASAELYDPASSGGTGSWTPVATMAIARFQHSATPLGDGTVLVAGGQDNAAAEGPPATASTEIYHPGASGGPGRWVPAAPMTTPRFSHTATLLADGRVLVAGGTTQESGRFVGLASAEIYDPNTLSWTIVPPMGHARNMHTATLVGDKVVVAGGFDLDPEGRWLQVGVPLSSVEVFDPATNAWSAMKSLSISRYAHTATALDDGTLLVAGGHMAGGPTNSSERYDAHANNGAGAWEPGQMNQARSGHSATALADGTVMVAGTGPMFIGAPTPPPSTATGEIYDPVRRRWVLTSPMSASRGVHTATVLAGAPCGRTAPPAWCGAVLVAGGGEADGLASSAGSATAITTAEIYTPAPHVSRVVPSAGVASQAGEVVLEGTGFAGADAVSFGPVPAQSFRVDSPTQITAMRAPGSTGVVEVDVVGPGGPSARTTPQPQANFTSYGAPAAVASLVARATSPTSVELEWPTPASDGSGTPPIEYVITQDGAALCGGRCLPRVPGHIEITDLSPSTTYRYSVAAINAVGLMGTAAQAEVTTPAVAGVRAACSPLGAPGPGEVRLAGGRYHLIGVPPGTQVSSNSPLYGWFDMGAGGAYSTNSTPEAGRGYWSFGFCDRLITLAAGGPTSASLPLGAYHASMVGNPSPTSPASVSGADFAARWDSDANGGAGAYDISGYREPTTLAVGQGSWLFSYSVTTVRIDGGS